LSELHVGLGPVERQPTALDRKLEPGAILLRAGLELKQKRSVDQLNVDPAICTASTELAISTSLRAAASGLA
jgi:hypothetical protein